MKKYLIIMAAVSMAIGGAINFTGCAPDGSNITADTTKGEPMPDTDKMDKAEEDKAKGGGGTPEEEPKK